MYYFLHNLEYFWSFAIHPNALALCLSYVMQDAVFAAMGGKYYARSKVEVSTVLYVFKENRVHSRTQQKSTFSAQAVSGCL
jgi:sulfur transfer complex TusBCD TusB component (DsrH family)